RLAEPRPPDGQRHHGRRPGRLRGRRRLPHLRPPEPVPRHHRRDPGLGRDQPDPDRRRAFDPPRRRHRAGGVTVLRRLALLLVLRAAAGAARAQTAPDPALVERGAYVARAGDCTSCHTAPTADAAPFAGGYAIPSPMGPIVSTNITPSKTHGIGNYSLEDF